MGNTTSDTPIAQQRFFDDLWSYNLKTNMWAWWRGSVVPLYRAQNATLFGSLPPLAGAGAAAHDGVLLIYGGLVMSAANAPEGRKLPYFELDAMMMFNSSDGSITRLAGGSNGYDFTFNGGTPFVGAATSPPAAAYPTLVWNTHAATGTSDVYMYGGVLAPSQAGFSYLSLDLANSLNPHSDSSVLTGLWRFSVLSKIWTRLDAPTVAMSANRGHPRIAEPLQSGFLSHPGGRVFAAMNIAPNGDVYLYGGRGHSSGFIITPSGYGISNATVQTLTSVPALSPFTYPLSSRFVNGADSNAVTLYAFVYSASELQNSGVSVNVPLNDLDIMLRLMSTSLAIGASTTTAFKVRAMLKTLEGVSFFNDTDKYNAAALRQWGEEVFLYPEHAFDARTWKAGTFMAVNSPMHSTGIDSALEPNQSLLLILRIEYSFSTALGLAAPTYVVDMLQTSGDTGVALITIPGYPFKNEYFTRYAFKPILMLRSRLPPIGMPSPRSSLSLYSRPQLDDLWVFSASLLQWRLQYGFPTALKRNVVSGSQRQSGVDYHWPGARQQASLMIPTSFTTATTASAYDVSLFLHGGYAVSPTVHEDYELGLNPDAPIALHRRRITFYDDLWSIDMGPQVIDSAAPGAAAYSTNSGASTAGLNLYTRGMPVYDEFMYSRLSQSLGNTCPSSSSCASTATCLAGGGSYFCRCASYTFGASCNNTAQEIALMQGMFKPIGGTTTLASLDLQAQHRPFSAVAVHPVTKEVWGYGGVTSNSDHGPRIQSSLVRTNLALRTHSEVSYVRGQTQSEQLSFTTSVTGFYPVKEVGVTYASATEPPPSADAMMSFSPSGNALYLYAESLVCSPGVWWFNTSSLTWASIGSFISENYPATNDHSAVYGSYGQYNYSYHPDARQGAAKASRPGLMCLYSGSQVYFPDFSAGTNDDLWCARTTDDPAGITWSRLAGLTSRKVAGLLPVAAQPGEFSTVCTPGARVGASLAFSTDGYYLYLFGGSLVQYGSTAQALMADLWVFSITNMTWAYLSGPTEPVTSLMSSHASSHSITSGSPSRLQYPGARMFASMAVSGDDMLYVSGGIRLPTEGTGATMVEKTTFATFVRPLHDTNTTLPTAVWAPSFTNKTAALAWVSIEVETGAEPITNQWFWSTNFINNGRFGTSMVFLPSTISVEAPFATDNTIMTMTAGMQMRGSVVAATAYYPYFSFPLYDSETAGLVLRTSPCRVNPCLNDGVCTICAAEDAMCSKGYIDTGITSSAYHCICSTRFFGRHCELTRETYRPPSAATSLPCFQNAEFGTSISSPCQCIITSPASFFGVFCSPLVSYSIYHNISSINDLNLATDAAIAVVHNAPEFMSLSLGAEINSTVIFVAGGSTEPSSWVTSDVLTAVLVTSRTTVKVHPPTSNNSTKAIYSGPNTYIGRHIGATLVYSRSSGMLFLYGGLHFDPTGTRRNLYERHWLITPGAMGTVRLPQILTLESRRDVVQIRYKLDTPSQVTSVDQSGLTFHSRSDLSVYPVGTPGARAYHSAAAVTIGEVEWIYMFGGAVINSGDTDVEYLSDLWRHRALASGTVQWEYVGCSLDTGYLPPANITIGASLDIKDGCPMARSHTQLVAVGNTLWLVGGRGVRGGYDDVWSFNTETEVFTLRSGLALKPLPATSSKHLISAFTGDVATTTMGSRYAHRCDVLPTGTSVYCYGGLTAHGVAADMYRRILPINLAKHVHYIGMNDVVNPFTLTRSGLFVALLPVAHLDAPGLTTQKQTIYGVTFFLADDYDMTSDAMTELVLSIGYLAAAPTDEPKDIDVPLSKTTHLIKASTFTNPRTFQFSLQAPVERTASSQYLVIRMSLSVTRPTRIDTRFAFGSTATIISQVPNTTNDYFTTYNNSRTKTCFFFNKDYS